MKKVLFVCLGNICRSPMAEAVLRHKISQRKLEKEIIVQSAGTSNWHVGKNAHQGTLKILQEKGINSDDLIARQLDPADMETYDYIVAMDSQNVADIKEMTNNHGQEKIIQLLDLLEEVDNKDVPDPYFTGNFQEVYNLIDAACEKLLDKIGK